MMFAGHFDLSISWLKAAAQTPNKNNTYCQFLNYSEGISTLILCKMLKHHSADLY